MKTLAFAIAALFVLPVAAHAGKKYSSEKKQDKKKDSSAKKPEALKKSKPMVVNYDLSGNPFLSTERVFSMH
jgi:hypothetical protein